MRRNLFGQSSLLFLCLIASILMACTHSEPLYTPPADDEKPGPRIDGVSFVGPPSPVEKSAFNAISDAKAGWVALLPFAFGRGGTTELAWDLTWQWWGEKKEGVRQEAVYAQNLGIKIMVKPQIWFRGGTYTGDFSLNSESDWVEFEEKYEQFIIEYATLAEEIEADMFCIGTELKNFFLARSKFWAQLIPKVREVYSGRLTYAGNWDSFDKFPFWGQMDFMGVDAYFPLSDSKTPSVKELKAGWQPHFEKLKSLSRKHGKQILFTEYGYKSVDFAASKPWEHRSSENVNMEAQANAYEALFQTFWSKEWFAGGFLWNWYADRNAGGQNDKDFTPQNKSAQDVVETWYAPY